MEKVKKVGATKTSPKKGTQPKRKQSGRSRSGAEAIQRSADAKAQTESEAIVQGLVNAAKEGKSTAVRLLYAITSDHAKTSTTTAKRKKSMAKQWAEEEEWSAHMSRSGNESEMSGEERK